ncbi:hypothetical protein JOD54_003336 [Actinokineospora baliensis]|uniref:hypothetical protein n=1 Tax=Actinokineospora baliensis TaxID=547056 RepID=UPI00195BACDE|nr:hypothetical protein [Actinokineospora baliensis]MBM7773132.1 hypothetical protein [Actinokineospora baliensis]
MATWAWWGKRFERTERRLVVIAAALGGAIVLLGVLGQIAVRERDARLDDAVNRRGALTAAALDVYRALADADATSLNAVVVEPRRSTDERKRFREDLFTVADALRMAASLAPEGTSAERVRSLTDYLPEYSRLVEAGWANSALGQPVGTSYLSQASFLVRSTMLPEAEKLHTEQAGALSDAQRRAGQQPWEVFIVGGIALALLVATQRYLSLRTRRRFNRGLVMSTALVLGSLITVGVAVGFARGHADDSVHEFDGVVAPLATARNLGRKADGGEVRILVFPKVGDVGELRDTLTAVEKAVGEGKAGGAEPVRIDRVATALRAWQTTVTPLGTTNPPLPYQVASGLITGTVDAAHAQEFDEALSDAINWHLDHAADSTAEAKESLAGIGVITGLAMFLALAAAGWGMWERIREYY